MRKLRSLNFTQLELSMVGDPVASFNVNLEPTFHFNADPDPAPYQSDATAATTALKDPHGCGCLRQLPKKCGSDSATQSQNL
jgi:hypothetical protein